MDDCTVMVMESWPELLCARPAAPAAKSAASASSAFHPPKLNFKLISTRRPGTRILKKPAVLLLELSMNQVLSLNQALSIGVNAPYSRTPVAQSLNPGYSIFNGPSYN